MALDESVLTQQSSQQGFPQLLEKKRDNEAMAGNLASLAMAEPSLFNWSGAATEPGLFNFNFSGLSDSGMTGSGGAVGNSSGDWMSALKSGYDIYSKGSNIYKAGQKIYDWFGNQYANQEVVGYIGDQPVTGGDLGQNPELAYALAQGGGGAGIAGTVGGQAITWSQLAANPELAYAIALEGGSAAAGAGAGAGIGAGAGAGAGTGAAVGAEIGAAAGAEAAGGTAAGAAGAGLASMGWLALPAIAYLLTETFVGRPQAKQNAQRVQEAYRTAADVVTRGDFSNWAGSVANGADNWAYVTTKGYIPDQMRAMGEMWNEYYSGGKPLQLDAATPQFYNSFAGFLSANNRMPTQQEMQSLWAQSSPYQLAPSGPVSPSNMDWSNPLTWSMTESR